MNNSKTLSSKSLGFTLVEILVAMSIGAALLSAVTTQFSSYLKISSEISGQELIKRLVTLNISEIEALPVDQLPSVGSCKLKKYDFQGQLLSVNNANGSDCLTPKVENGEQEIAWIVSDQQNLKATFSHSKFMKLPTQSNPIIKVEVRASSKELQSENVRTFILTLFKG